MKKLSTLLLFLICFWSSKTIAQDTTCNAGFHVTYQNGNTLQFNPMTIGSPPTFHYWNFGDGSSSNDVFPIHTYFNGSVFTVYHSIVSYSNGVITCNDSAFMIVQVQTTPPPCNLAAGFYSYRDTTVLNPYTYHFQNTTVPLHNTDSIRWIFGDGTSSNQVNPNHTYSQPGNYLVCFRVQQRDSVGILTNCVSETCDSIVVAPVNIPCNLTANFYSYADTTTTNLYTYQFVNTTTPLNNTDSSWWTFGDGTSSSQVHPQHTFNHPGAYTVCLYVQQINPNGGVPNCNSQICHTITIIQTPPPCNLVANFYSYSDTLSGTTLNTYHFQNTSTPTNANDSIRWTFGDGTSSNQVNPNHTYTQSGTYTVCLRVQQRDSLGILTNCVSEICHVITIAAICNIQSNFSWIVDSVNHKTVYYTNLTTPANTNATILWNLGDGTTSTQWNPVHTYSQPGTYNVCLYVQLSQTCTGYLCHSVVITSAPPPPVDCQHQSAFNFSSASGNSQLFSFTPLTVNNNAQYTWTFGDGTGSHDITSTHHYAQAGNYTGCLTVYMNANCASTTCKPVHVAQQVNCDSAFVSYTYTSDSLFPNRYYFHAISNYQLTDQTWTITKASGTIATLHQNNPSYTFTDTGYYYVCLRAVTAGGCIKQYCQYIFIDHINTSNTCNLHVFPNPAVNLITTIIPLNYPEMIHIYIYNSSNILVKEKHQQGTSGNNIAILPVANLVSGIYTMKVIHGNSICYTQFVKL